MRGKAAQIVRKAAGLFTSAGIGYLFGRVHQRAHDEGRSSGKPTLGLDGFKGVADYLREKERHHHD